jgi:hypothetical protein
MDAAVGAFLQLAQFPAKRVITPEGGEIQSDFRWPAVSTNDALAIGLVRSTSVIEYDVRIEWNGNRWSCRLWISEEDAVEAEAPTVAEALCRALLLQTVQG